MLIGGFYMLAINFILNSLNDFLYTYILIGLLVICGIYFSFKTKFVQIRYFSESLRLIREKSSKAQISSFQALMISTASRVGTGNIAGITTALVSGGPSSVFWMWIMAIFGTASAFVESTLAQIYKVYDDDGVSFRGGPAYYIQSALGKRNIGILFSSLLILCFSCGFNALQSYQISSSFDYYIPEYGQNIWHFVIGTVLSLITALVIFGGTHRIGFISSAVVPFMASIYIGVGVYITFINLDKLPAIVSLIIKDAMDFKSIFGGFAGSAVLIGIKRGLFSNEAGMGSAPNASATADVSHPVKQGIVQVLSVFIDTLICTATAFIILSSKINLDGHLDGIPLVQQALNNELGKFGIHFISISIFLFAFSSIIGNYCYSESNILFIHDSPKLLTAFRIFCILPVFLGAISSSDLVWNFADICMGLMSIVNIISILLLSDRVIICLKDYSKQKAKGIEPCFNALKCDIKDTHLWK